MQNKKLWSSSLALLLVIYSCLSSQASPRVIYSSISTGQIRISEPLNQAPIVPANPPQPPALSPTIISNPAPSPPPKPSVNILQLNLSIIPASNRGILYDTSRAIDSSNPVRIINSAQGGYSSIFVQDDQYFNFSIGTIPTSGNGIKPAPEGKLDLANLNFLSGAVLQSSASPFNLKLADISITETYSLGVTGHGRLRYTTADRDFRINGFLVPTGFIVVARRKPDLEHKGYPDLEDFEDFRVYDPSNSALVKVFNYDQLKSSNCLDNRCFDMNKFSTPRDTWQYGAKIFSNFSSRDLFGSVPPWTANKLWISMQANLEAQTILRINSRSEDWARRVLEEFNEDEFNYINHINNYEMKLASTRSLRLSLIKEYFGFADIAYPDQKAQELHEKIFENLWSLALAKTQKWQNQNSALKNSLAQEISDKREIFIDSLNNYDNYIKTAKTPAPVTSVARAPAKPPEIAQNPQSAPKTPAKAPPRAPKAPKKGKS